MEAKLRWCVLVISRLAWFKGTQSPVPILSVKKKRSDTCLSLSVQPKALPLVNSFLTTCCDKSGVYEALWVYIGKSYVRGTNKMNKNICNRGDVVGVIRNDRARLAGVFSPSPKYDSARINWWPSSDLKWWTQVKAPTGITMTIALPSH